MLTYLQFEVLVRIEKNQKKAICLETIANSLDTNQSLVEKTMVELKELELINVEGDDTYTLTLKGYEWLEPYRVKKAVFMAAGFGSRMVPVTLNTPKPLIRVNGIRIIETLLDAVIGAGITDITIVRGYLGEQFDTLLRKYPMIKFIDNVDYNKANNISSAYLMKDIIANAYVLESDLVLYNPELIRKYEYSTNYLGMKVDHTDDWCFKVKDGYIAELHIGADDCHHMFGISYWTKEDALKMSVDIEKVYTGEDGANKYWDEVPLKYCFDNYSIRVRPVHQGDIIEIDTFEELKAVDSIYDC